MHGHVVFRRAGMAMTVCCWGIGKIGSYSRQVIRPNGVARIPALSFNFGSLPQHLLL